MKTKDLIIYVAIYQMYLDMYAKNLILGIIIILANNYIT